MLSRIQTAAQTEVAHSNLKGGKTYYTYDPHAAAYTPFVYDPKTCVLAQTVLCLPLTPTLGLNNTPHPNPNH